MKFISVKLQDYTSTVNRLHYRFFSENLPKTSYLKGTFFKKTYGIKAF